MTSDPKDPSSPSGPSEPPDPDEVRRALLHLRVAFDDADAVVNDMLRPARERELGHVQHARLYREARRAVVETVAYLMRAHEGREPGGGMH